MATYNAGIVTAYGAAVQGGYTGTYEEFCIAQANIAINADRAEDAADRAESAADSMKGVSNTVRQAIFALLSKAIYTETGLTDEKAIIEDWASVTAVGIVLSEQSISFNGEGTHQLLAILTPPDSTDEPLWSTSNANVAVVSQTGLVSTVGNGSCTISASIGSLVATCNVTVTGIVTYYSISNVLTKVENSNDSEVIVEDSAYSATLTASTGYAIDAVTVTMGGTDVTSTVYSNGEINIPAVTGNIEITASAVLKGTNLMTPVTSENWNISAEISVTDASEGDFTEINLNNKGLNWNANIIQKNLTVKSNVLSGKTLFIEFDCVISGKTSDTDKTIFNPCAFDRASPTSGNQRKGYWSCTVYESGHYAFEAPVSETSIELSSSYYFGLLVYFYGSKDYGIEVSNLKYTYY